jgi:hypothetical protein
MLTRWQQWLPGCDPVAHQLRMAFPDRWVRFHSLPGSKRYPEGEAEYATLLERHNRILGALAQPEEAIILLSTGYSTSPEPVRPQPEWQLLDPMALPWRMVAMHELDAPFFLAPSYWHVFASERVWQPSHLDPIIRLVADDVLANVMVVSPDCRWLLHPYDSGMDVIAESSAARDRLKRGHARWLSARADGL